MSTAAVLGALAAAPSEAMSGKRVVVAGAGSEVGEAVVRHLLLAGARVLAVDSAGADAARDAELQGAPHDVEFRDVQTSSSEEVQELAMAVRRRWGGLDALVTIPRPVPSRHVFEITASEWDEGQEPVRGVFCLTRALAPLMGEGHGSIVNITTHAAVVGVAGMSATSAAYGGIVLLSKTCALDLAPQVRVNVIVAALHEWSAPHVVAAGGEIDAQMLKRACSPDDVAQATVFLTSPASSFVTGAVVPVDGGWTAQ